MHTLNYMHHTAFRQDLCLQNAFSSGFCHLITADMQSCCIALCTVFMHSGGAAALVLCFAGHDGDTGKGLCRLPGVLNGKKQILFGMHADLICISAQVERLALRVLKQQIAERVFHALGNHPAQAACATHGVYAMASE